MRRVSEKSDVGPASFQFIANHPGVEAVLAVHATFLSFALGAGVLVRSRIGLVCDIWLDRFQLTNFRQM